MANSNAGVVIYADTRSFNRMARNLRAVSPGVYKRLQVALRTVATKTLSKAAANAGYSNRLPQSGRVRLRVLNAAIQFGGDAAPDAAPIENRGKGLVRHPVYGNRDVWTDKNSHPAFLGPAFEQDRAEAMAILDEQVFRALEEMSGM